LLLTAALLPAAAQAQSVTALTPQDYIEIGQLTARYTHAVDNCSNRGYDYADLYADDGTFGVSREWGVPGKVWAQGRDALAKAGGGTEDGCRVKLPGTQGYGLHHVVTSQVIEPTTTGAKGRSTLLTLGVGGKPTNIEWQGGYEDTYVKTPKGWRIQSRWHVWPDLENSIQFIANPLPAALLPERATGPTSGQ
jgi:hypothetical protein